MSKILATELNENNYTHAIISGDICRLNKILQKDYNVECLFTDLDYNKFIIIFLIIISYYVLVKIFE